MAARYRRDPYAAPSTRARAEFLARQHKARQQHARGQAPPTRYCWEIAAAWFTFGILVGASVMFVACLP